MSSRFPAVSLSLHFSDRRPTARRRNPRSSGSLLLLRILLDVGFLHHGGDFAKHHNAVAIHKGHTGEALAILERVAYKRLLRGHGDLSHLIRLQAVWLLHLLSTGFLAHLPFQLDDS